jgi:protein-arginine kinase activator protein McsA
MTLDEVRAGKLVGCAYCYRTMRAGVYPLIKKMQGDGAHTGERPPLSSHRDYENLEHYSEDEKKNIIQEARLEKQCRELETIIEKLKAEKDYEAAKDYAGKLSAMRENLEIQEEFVWRTRPTSKQP